jgi:hypothetical protein
MKLQDNSHKEEDICGSCKKAFTEDESAIKCEGICCQLHHKDCSGITQGEFDIMKRNKCKLLWLCDICKPQLLKEKEQAEPKGRPCNAGTNKGYEGNDGKRRKKDEQPEHGNKANGQQGKATVPRENKRQEWESNRTVKARERKYRKRKEEHHRMKRRMSKTAVQTETSQTGMYKNMESNNRGWKSLLEEKCIRVNPEKTQQSLAP